MPFGAHMSISGGVGKSFARGASIGIEAMQIFAKNDRQWQAKPYAEADIAFYKAEAERTGIGPVIVHDSYLINLASPDDALWEKSIAAFADELERCAVLGIQYLVTHPGAHMRTGEDVGIARQVEAMNRLFEQGVGGDVMVLLETTAGQGTVLGWRFDQLARMIEGVRLNQRIGVCVDTCHILAAGYDIRTPEAYDATMQDFARTVGLDRIKALHLNDSQKELGSRVDRHTHIGHGFVGLEGFRLIVNDPRLQHLPMVIETPKNDDMAEDVQNLTLLRSLVGLSDAASIELPAMPAKS